LAAQIQTKFEVGLDPSTEAITRKWMGFHCQPIPEICGDSDPAFLRLGLNPPIMFWE
jgi:hypothetical protein